MLLQGEPRDATVSFDVSNFAALYAQFPCHSAAFLLVFVYSESCQKSDKYYQVSYLTLEIFCCKTVLTTAITDNGL